MRKKHVLILAPNATRSEQTTRALYTGRQGPTFTQVAVVIAVPAAWCFFGTTPTLATIIWAVIIATIGWCALWGFYSNAMARGTDLLKRGRAIRLARDGRVFAMYGCISQLIDEQGSHFTNERKVTYEQLYELLQKIVPPWYRGHWDCDAVRSVIFMQLALSLQHVAPLVTNGVTTHLLRVDELLKT